MSSLTGLSTNQVLILGAVRDWDALHPQIPVPGALIAQKLSRGPQGVHTTASSLVRKGALEKHRTGGKQVCYRITAHGSILLSREEHVHERSAHA